MSTMPVPLSYGIQDTGSNKSRETGMTRFLPSGFGDLDGGGQGGGQGGGVGGGGSWPNFGPTTGQMFAPANIIPQSHNIGDNIDTISPLSPELTSNFFGWLQSQIGQGATPYPGNLTAPLNPIMQMLQQFYQTGGQTNLPGFNTLQNFSQGGATALPAWQSMVDAMQRQIGQGATNLKEQFNFAGGLASSPFGTAAADYQLQSSKDLNALLGQMQLATLPLQLGASQFLASGAGDLGQFLQSLDQESVMRMYAEFMRTQPEYSPLLNQLFGASTTFPPTVTPNYGIGAGGALLQSAGSIASGIADIIGSTRGGGSVQPTPGFGGGGGGDWGGGGGPIG